MVKKLKSLLNKAKTGLAIIGIAASSLLPMEKNANALESFRDIQIGDSDFIVSGDFDYTTEIGYLHVWWDMDPESTYGTPDWGYHVTLNDLYVGGEGSLISYSSGWTPTITTSNGKNTYDFDTAGGYISPAPIRKLDAVIKLPIEYAKGPLTYTRDTSIGNYYDVRSDGTMPSTPLVGGAPEPISSALFIAGGATLGLRGLRRYLKRRNESKKDIYKKR